VACDFWPIFVPKLPPRGSGVHGIATSWRGQGHSRAEVAVACDFGLVAPSRWHWRAIFGRFSSQNCHFAGRGCTGLPPRGDVRPRAGRGGSGVRFRAGRSVEVAVACDFGPVAPTRWQWRAFFGSFSSQNCHLAGRGCTGLPPRGEIRGVVGTRWQWRAVSGWWFRRGGSGVRFRAGHSVEVAVACGFWPIFVPKLPPRGSGAHGIATSRSEALVAAPRRPHSPRQPAAPPAPATAIAPARNTPTCGLIRTALSKST
jgi:hypothetical protein